MSIKLSNNRYEELKKIATNILVKLNINNLPVSGFEFLTKLDVKIIPYSTKDLEFRIKMMQFSEDGFSVYKNNKWFVFYNDSQIYERINNTLMHEGAHIVLNHSQESDVAEAEANFFAKYVLAPPVLIHQLGLKTLQQIKDTFRLSNEASNYALDYYHKWLTYGNIGITYYEKQMLNLFFS